ncbi:hypothetical protein [Kamptonema formosum]|nr:hypothetical protein [Oscillatoria sp. PCC 10802]
MASSNPGNGIETCRPLDPTAITPFPTPRPLPGKFPIESDSAL